MMLNILMLNILMLAAVCIIAHSTRFERYSNDSEYLECWNFLVDNMPPRDVGTVLDPVLNESITYALLTRHMDLYNGYTDTLPFDIFTNYVLPYAILSESRDNWRKYFYDRLYPLVINNTEMNQLNVSSIALWFVNNQNKLFNLYFDADSTPLVYSPFEVLSYGYGSCTGYSLFVVAALRSIGIAARVVGTPQWVFNCTNLTGNHNWISIYDENGYWSFTDAPGGYDTMNTTWFYPEDTSCQIAGDLNHSIYASSFRKNHDSSIYFVMEWDRNAKYVPAFDVTDDYRVLTALHKC
eukprot:468877_1